MKTVPVQITGREVYSISAEEAAKRVEQAERFLKLAEDFIESPDGS